MQYLHYAGKKCIRSVLLFKSIYQLLSSINIISLVDLSKLGHQFLCAQNRLLISKNSLYSPLSEDADSPNDLVEIRFLRYSCQYLEFSKKDDSQVVNVKYVFMGPCIPSETMKLGYIFIEDNRALEICKFVKTHWSSINLL